jgi:hypothetical protein
MAQTPPAPMRAWNSIGAGDGGAGQVRPRSERPRGQFYARMEFSAKGPRTNATDPSAVGSAPGPGVYGGKASRAMLSRRREAVMIAPSPRLNPRLIEKNLTRRSLCWPDQSPTCRHNFLNSSSVKMPHMCAGGTAAVRCAFKARR